MENTYNDPAKKLSRDRLRHFIQKHVLPYKKAKDVRVMCFPGAEREGEEALEVREVYDPLKIPRENIVGLECIPEVAQRLERANLGLKVIPSRAKEFFINTPEAPFDVISLDYKGQQTLDETGTLEAIAGRQLLNSHGVLATNYFGTRESSSMRRLFALRLMNAELNKPLMRKIFREDTSVEEAHAIVPAYGNILQDLTANSDLNALRDAITVETIQIFAGGTINPPVSRHFYQGDADYQKFHPQLCGTFQENNEEFARNAAQENGLSLKKNLEYMAERAEHRAHITEYHRNIIASEEKLAEMLPFEHAEAVLGAFHRAFQKSYNPVALERYSYTSNKGSPMLFDLFAFTHQPGDITTLLKKTFSYEHTPNGMVMKVNPAILPVPKLTKNLEKIRVRFNETIRTPLHPRMELVPQDVPVQISSRIGPAESAYVPSSEEKREIYAWLDDGAADDEICNAYNISDRQLAAYKAHVTMKQNKANQTVPSAAGK